MFKSQFALMANYNKLMNRQIIDSMDSLSDEQLWEDKGAFFGSIMGTLNHLMVGDLIWMWRFNQHPNCFKALDSLSQFPVPQKLNQTIYINFAKYQEKRDLLDKILIELIDETVPVDYQISLCYKSTKGMTFTKPFVALLLHLFNHQTHHRGQVTTILSQLDIDIGSTDLLMLIDEA